MAPPVRVGEILEAKYRVEQVLGAGGMGVVVAARHLALGERVAIKLLVDRLGSSPHAVTRFLREGRAAARIRSEHVARVHDVGTLPTGIPYMVMEYLPGRDLGALVREEGPLPVDVAVDRLLQAALGLAAAHARGIVHRDLKPSNLFLTTGADGLPLVKIIDFGISKDRGGRPSGEGDVHTTSSHVVMGSPAYMSPEQMRSSRDVDARGDIWALGAILHCLLTGKPPFPGDSIPEIHESILAGPPILSDALPGAPEGLEAVLHRCFQRRPEDRYPDVAALAAALAPFGPPHAAAQAASVARILQAGAPAETAHEEPMSDLGASHPPSDPATTTGAPREASWMAAEGREISQTANGGLSAGAPQATAIGDSAATVRARGAAAWPWVLLLAVAGGVAWFASFASRTPPAPRETAHSPATSPALTTSAWPSARPPPAESDPPPPPPPPPPAAATPPVAGKPTSAPARAAAPTPRAAVRPSPTPPPVVDAGSPPQARSTRPPDRPARDPLADPD